MTNGSLEGRRILVTGFNGSIGGAIWNEIESAGGIPVGLSHIPDERAAAVCDFQDDEALIAAVSGIGGHFDGVVISHGIIEKAPLAELDAARWRIMLDVNLTSSFVVLQTISGMLLHPASIVVISSTAGLRYARNAGAHYTVSKWGLNGLVRHLAAEFGPAGTRINAICPGHMDNPMSHSINTPETIAAALQIIPLRRAGLPRDIGSVARFLLSDDSEYITGAFVPVAGGMQ